VPTYGFDCSGCGAFDLVRPMAQASKPAACPACNEPARRTWGALALRAVDPGLRRALDASARTADAPDVVRSIPPRRRGVRTTTDSRHLRLPRP
jgi:putative FmdB family regulatory protein